MTKENEVLTAEMLYDALHAAILSGVDLSEVPVMLYNERNNRATQARRKHLNLINLKRKALPVEFDTQMPLVLVIAVLPEVDVD